MVFSLFSVHSSLLSFPWTSPSVLSSVCVCLYMWSSARRQRPGSRSSVPSFSLFVVVLLMCLMANNALTGKLVLPPLSSVLALCLLSISMRMLYLHILPREAWGQPLDKAVHQHHHHHHHCWQTANNRHRRRKAFTCFLYFIWCSSCPFKRLTCPSASFSSLMATAHGFGFCCHDHCAPSAVLVNSGMHEHIKVKRQADVKLLPLIECSPKDDWWRTASSALLLPRPPCTSVHIGRHRHFPSSVASVPCSLLSSQVAFLLSVPMADT